MALVMLEAAQLAESVKAEAPLPSLQLHPPYSSLPSSSLPSHWSKSKLPTFLPLCTLT